MKMASIATYFGLGQQSHRYLCFTTSLTISWSKFSVVVFLYNLANMILFFLSILFGVCLWRWGVGRGWGGVVWVLGDGVQISFAVVWLKLQLTNLLNWNLYISTWRVYSFLKFQVRTWLYQCHATCMLCWHLGSKKL